MCRITEIAPAFTAPPAFAGETKCRVKSALCAATVLMATRYGASRRLKTQRE
jgi:hypothetical protein